MTPDHHHLQLHLSRIKRGVQAEEKRMFAKIRLRMIIVISFFPDRINVLVSLETFR